MVLAEMAPEILKQGTKGLRRGYFHLVIVVVLLMWIKEGKLPCRLFCRYASSLK